MLEDLGPGQNNVNSQKPKCSVTTATAAQVLANYKFNDGDCNSVTGTMINRGAASQTIGVGGSYTIPEGYHNGQGKVTFSATPTAASVTANANTGNQTYNITAGYYNQVTVNQTNPYNTGYNAGNSAGYNTGYNAGYSAGGGGIKVISKTITGIRSSSNNSDVITVTANVSGDGISTILGAGMQDFTYSGTCPGWNVNIQIRPYNVNVKQWSLTWSGSVLTHKLSAYPDYNCPFTYNITYYIAGK